MIKKYGGTDKSDTTVLIDPLEEQSEIGSQISSVNVTNTVPTTL